MGRRSWIGLIIVLGLSPIGAIAGEVRVDGDTIIFDAGIGEVNTVTINPRGSVFDQSTGQFVSGFTITDSTTPMVVRSPCRAFGGVALCQDVALARAVIKLGNKNDSVKQDFSFDQGGTPLPMTVEGGPGDDKITGGPLADTLDGGDGNDTIDGGDGDDVINGGFGDDRIVGGRGADILRGGAGADTIDARDGEVDTINCGLGRDTLLRDSNDSFSRCER